MRITLTPGLITHRNDISLRFKTPLDEGFLFQTQNAENDDSIKAVLEDGEMAISTNFDGLPQVKMCTHIKQHC